MKSLSIITLVLAIIAFSVSFVAGYLQVYNSTRINDLYKQQQKMSEDLLDLQQQVAQSWKSEKGHPGHSGHEGIKEQPWPKFHQVKAVVKLITDDKIVVDQEEIPNFMKAMTRGYKVENSEQLKNLKPDDRVNLKLKETDTDLTVIEINKIEK